MNRPASARPGRIPWGSLGSSAFIAGSVFLTSRSNRARASKGMLMLLMVLGLMVSGMVACGGNPPASHKTQAQNYSIMVTGASGSVQHSTSVSLTVQ